MIKLTSSNTDVYGYRVNNYIASLSDRDTNISVRRHEYGFTATEENYDGDEDKIRIAHSFKSEDEAISNLIEKMEEAIAEDRI